MSVLLGLLSSPTLLAVLGGIVATVAAFMRGRVSGAQRERAARDRARLQAIKDRKEKDDEVDSLAPADLDERFKRWM